MRLSTLVPVLALLVCAGCDDAPQPLHGVARETAVSFTGRVDLKGDVASADQGVFFVVVRNQGTTMPSLTRRYEASDVRGDAQSGRYLPFRVGSEDNMSGMGAPLGETLELQVIFDRDGSLTTQEDALRAVVPARRNAADLHVVLGS
jgi:hypothetical protein